MKHQNWNTIPVLLNERTRPVSARMMTGKRGGPDVARMFETTMTVPTRNLPELMTRLARAGFTVMDTGHRVMTDDGPDGEATLRLLQIPLVEILDPALCELGVRA